MGVRGLGLALLCVAGLAAVPVEAQESEAGSAGASVSVLLAPVQGSRSRRDQDGARVAAAVRGAFEARGYQVSGSQELLGRAVVACQTPECIEQALDAAKAGFAIVPAIWSRKSGGEEVTLTLVQRSGRSLNASGMVGDELFGVTDGLVEELLARREGAGTETGTGAETETGGRGGERGRPHAWKAGPIVLIAGGAIAIVAIGVGAGVKNDNQQLNTSAVAAWAAVGAAAIGGGIAWWVVGERRRRKNGDAAAALAPELALQPTKIDLRLRF